MINSQTLLQGVSLGKCSYLDSDVRTIGLSMFSHRLRLFNVKKYGFKKLIINGVLKQNNNF